MQRHWSLHIRPVIAAASPARIIEIGADTGANTRNILAYCRETGCHADIIDPAPQPSLERVLEAFPGTYTFHKRKSLDVLPSLEPADVVLIDGDHNWYTVIHELEQVFAGPDRRPIVMLHDVAWPYARRDMYYNPADIPQKSRQPYAYTGMLPGEPELREEGMNGSLANALLEGGPENGVLTAVEDFLSAAPAPISFWSVPYFNGLGILVPTARLTPSVSATIESFYTGESLLRACEALERDATKLRIAMGGLTGRLSRRTDALTRARSMVQERDRTIRELRKQLPAKAGPTTGGDPAAADK